MTRSSRHLSPTHQLVMFVLVPTEPNETSLRHFRACDCTYCREPIIRPITSGRAGRIGDDIREDHNS